MDTKLQTALTSDGLQNRLLALYRDARLIMEEQGVKYSLSCTWPIEVVRS